MKIVICSDLHGNLPILPIHDILLLAGDIFRGLSLEDDIRWAGKHLAKWLNQSPLVIGCLGNHDYNYAYYRSHFPQLKWNILHDKLLEINGLRIYGSSWTCPIGINHNLVRDWWAYLANEEQLSFIWKNIPENLDFLITHCPAHKIMDIFKNQHLGSPSLGDEIIIKKPKYHITGHIHEQPDRVIRCKNITFINAAMCDNNNKLIHNPIIIDI